MLHTVALHDLVAGERGSDRPVYSSHHKHHQSCGAVDIMCSDRTGGHGRGSLSAPVASHYEPNAWNKAFSPLSRQTSFIIALSDEVAREIHRSRVHPACSSWRELEFEIWTGGAHTLSCQ